jgi:DNA gyrase/topoisomerase IV subunit B
MPDPTIFDTVEWVESTEVQRMKQAAYLTPGVTFTIVSRKSGVKERFYYE